MILPSVRFICPFCSLYCSDIEITGMVGASPVLEPYCEKAKIGLCETLRQDCDPRVSGTQTTWKHALEEAVSKIRSSHRPLVLLTGDVSCEEASAGITLAQKANACVDTYAAFAATAWLIGAFSPGVRTCSAEAIRGRAVVTWGVDFVRNAPRFFDRFFDAGEKRLFSINSRLPIPLEGTAFSLSCPDSVLELLVDLNRALRKLPASSAAAELAKALKDAGSGCILAGVDQTTSMDGWYLAELAQLTNILEEKTGMLWDFFPLFPGSNWNGAQAALEMITGYPGSIRFKQRREGHLPDPFVEYSPIDYTAEKLLKRREADLLICIGGESWVEFEVDHDQPIDTIVLSASPPAHEVQIWMPVAKYGIHTDGTALRFDGAPFSLSQIIEIDRPTVSELLRRMVDAL